MNWIKTERGGYVNLERAYYMYVSSTPLGDQGSGKFSYKVIARFPVVENTSVEKEFESVEITIKTFQNREEAQQYLESLTELDG